MINRAFVILTTFNRPVFVYNLLKSIAQQQGVDNMQKILYVVDDHSNEETINAILDGIELFDNSWTIHQFDSDALPDMKTEQCSFCISINQAIRHIRDNYGFDDHSMITYSCDDAEFQPTKLASLAKSLFVNDVAYHMINIKTVDTIDGKLVPAQRNGSNSMLVRDGVIGTPFNRFLLQQGSHCNYIDHNSLGHKTSLLSKIPDPWWVETADQWDRGDWTFWNKLLNVVAGFKFVPEVLDTKYIHNHNMQQHNINKTLHLVNQETMLE